MCEQGCGSDCGEGLKHMDLVHELDWFYLYLSCIVAMEHLGVTDGSKIVCGVKVLYSNNISVMVRLKTDHASICLFSSS